MKLKWEDPPAGRGTSAGVARRWLAEAAELRAHPGQWAMLKHSNKWPGNLAYNIRTGRLLPFKPAGAFEAVQSKGQILGAVRGREGVT